MAALNQETRDILDKIIADAVSLLPEETRKGVREAFSVSIAAEEGDSLSVLRHLKALKKATGSTSTAYFFHKAYAEDVILDHLAARSPEQSKYLRSARKDYKEYLLSDCKGRKEEEILFAKLEKARLDFIAGYRKGTFLGIIEVPKGTDINEKLRTSDISVRGMKVVSFSDKGMIGKTKSGTILGAELNTFPSIKGEKPLSDLILVIARTGEAGPVEAAERFIEFSSELMRIFSSDVIYVNGAMLSYSDTKEALGDIASDAFPIWFFARGSEDDDGDSFTLRAEGAASFGAKTIIITDVPAERKSEAASALSVILMLFIYSPSSRNENTFIFEDTLYRKVSSDTSSVLFRMEERDE